MHRGKSSFVSLGLCSKRQASPRALSARPAIGKHAPSRGVLYFDDNYYGFRTHRQRLAFLLSLPCTHTAPRAAQNKEHFVRQLLQPPPAACHQPGEAPLFLVVIYLHALHPRFAQAPEGLKAFPKDAVLRGGQWWLVYLFVSHLPFF